MNCAPVDLVFAALLFEYVDADPVLKSVRRFLNPAGRLVTVVQLPWTDGPAVTPSPFTSLQSLSPCMQLVSPESLRERAAAHGFSEVDSKQITSTGGKAFQVQNFAARQPERPMSATYTPGHSQNATEFMARRTVESHGEFFVPYLTQGVSVLDCGCGPGSITLSIARRIGTGPVVGIDFGESQIQRASESAQELGIDNAVFEQADCYSLPFEDASFDRVFSNALLEHLADPVRAIREMFRVLKPDGMIGVSSPDWGGFTLAPPSDALTAAVAAYTALQTRNGGDVNVGRKLGSQLTAAGFEGCQMSARYEIYPSLTLIGEFLALQLDSAGDAASAAIFRGWSRQPGGLFAQCWVSCIARKGKIHRRRDE